MKGKQMKISATRKTNTLPPLVPSPSHYINLAFKKRRATVATPFPIIIFQ